MKTQEPTYIDFTPIELWRLGVKNSPRIDKVRVPPRPPGATVDIQTYTNGGQEWVKAGTGGVSLFDGKNPRLDGIHWWRIPANSPIPKELKITKNHKDRVTGLTHYRIEPIFDLPLHHFIYLLTIFAKNAEKAFSASNEHEAVKS
ncbi:MAG: hypothetical protein AB1810_01965 [Pseudomonadota bacterium]